MGRKIKEINELHAELLLLRKRRLEAGRNRTRKSRANAKKKNLIQSQTSDLSVGCQM